MPQKSLVELAREGNPKAITELLNRNLQKYNITAKVNIKDQQLKVLFESDQVPLQERMYAFMRKGMESLKPEAISRVNLYGKAFNQDIHEWEQSFEIKEPLDPQVSLTKEGTDKIQKIAKTRAVPSEIDYESYESPFLPPQEMAIHKIDNSAYCPNCGSSHLQIRKDTNVSWGRAAVGWALFGVFGSAVGAVTGEDKNAVACLNCGTTWKAQDLFKIKNIIKEKTGKALDLSKDDDRDFMNKFISEFGKSGSLTNKERIENYKNILDSTGNFPKGIYSSGLELRTITRYLSKNINPGENLIDVTGVRHEGTVAYFILTTQRVMCLLPHKKIFEASLNNLQEIEAGENGLQIRLANEPLKFYQFYYVSPHVFESFKKSLSYVFHHLKSVNKISISKSEKSAVFSEIVAGLILLVIMVFLFGSCISDSGKNSSSSSTEDKEACLRRYIRGETVSASEIQEAYDKCIYLFLEK
jgi:hypothetical protein